MIEAMGEGVDAELERFEAGREVFDAVELGTLFTLPGPTANRAKRLSLAWFPEEGQTLYTRFY